MGTHGHYPDRYPKTYDYFNNVADIKTENRSFLATNSYGKDKINEYDNAIRYNDMIISEIISALKEKKTYSYLLYVSDHGEEVYDSRRYFSHQESNATPFMFEIPFVVWLSPEYRAVHFNNFEVFKTQENRSYQTDDIIHSILDLSHIVLSQFDSTKSIFNAGFLKEKRHIGPYDYDTLKLDFEGFKKDLKL